MTAIAAGPRQLLGVDDLGAAGIDALLELAAIMRRHPLAWRGALEGQAVACLFEQPSTRSRVALEVAITRLGALPVTLAPERLDVLADVAGSYCDAIAVRTPHHRDLLAFAERVAVPVVNLRSDREHPCRALADCLTLRNRFGSLDGLCVAYVGDSDALAYSLIEAAILSGFELRIAAPADGGPDPALLARAGESVRLLGSPRDARRGAAAVFEDGLITAAGQEQLGREQLANLLPVQQAVLRGLVTGDWEA
jgi:ornithine carbamoyltransferase